MVELWSEPLKRRYSNSRFSFAYLFYLGYYVALVIVPFYAAYASYGLWKKDGTYLEQPSHIFEHQLVVTLETNTGSILSWSTMPEYNAMLTSQELRVPSVAALMYDDNHDGLNDRLSLNITMPLQSTERVVRSSIWTFFKSTVSDHARMEMTSLLPIDYASAVPGSKLVIDGDVKIAFTGPISTMSTRTDYIKSVLAPSSIQSLDDILPETVYQRIAARNDTLTLTPRVPPIWKSLPSSSTPTSFMAQLTLRFPKQEIPYIPGPAEVIKVAWVQYLAIFIILAWIMSFVRSYVFRYQVVETYVTNDMKPPQKMHKF